MVATKKPATYEDVLAAPAHMVAEILNGELVLTPRPRFEHGRVSSRVFGALDELDDPEGGDRGGWIILYEIELHLGADVLVPDLVGWRRERLREVPRGAGVTVVPDWVCEVASPSTQRHDRIVKSTSYLRHGVPWMWLISPTDRVVEVFRHARDHWALAATAVGDEPARLPPFEELELALRRWWLPL